MYQTVATLTRSLDSRNDESLSCREFSLCDRYWSDTMPQIPPACVLATRLGVGPAATSLEFACETMYVS